MKDIEQKAKDRWEKSTHRLQLFQAFKFNQVEEVDDIIFDFLTDYINESLQTKVSDEEIDKWMYDILIQFDGDLKNSKRNAYEYIRDISDTKYKDFKKWLRSKTVDSWVSVEDRLPTETMEVLMCGKEWGYVQYGYFKISSKTFVTSDYCSNCGESEEIEKPTHWMPLPNPPKQYNKL